METKINGKDVLTLSDSDMKKLKEIEKEIKYHEEQHDKYEAEGKTKKASDERQYSLIKQLERSIVLKEHLDLCYLLDPVWYDPNEVLLESMALKLANMAIKAGADVNARDKYGMCPLEYALTPKMAKLLIDAGANINDAFRRGRLWDAEILKTLIDAGADIKKYGTEALLNTRDVKQKEILLELGVKMNTNEANSGLLYTASVDFAKSCIEMGADINTKDSDGCTPLINAARNGNERLVRFLINMGADVNATKNDGTNALFAVKDLGTAQRLVYAGADVNNATTDGFTVLMRAVEACYDPELIKFLLDHGADMNAKTKDRYKATVWSYDPTPEITKILREAEREPESKKLERAKIQNKNAETKKRIKEKLKKATKELSGVVIADKIADMKHSGKIKGDVTPKTGKEIRAQIMRDWLKDRK